MPETGNVPIQLPMIFWDFLGPTSHSKKSLRSETARKIIEKWIPFLNRVFSRADGEFYINSLNLGDHFKSEITLLAQELHINRSEMIRWILALEMSSELCNEDEEDNEILESMRVLDAK